MCCNLWSSWQILFLEERKAWKMKKTEYLFKEIIEEIKEVYLEEGETKLCADSQWCVCAKSSDLDLESACYVLPYPAYNVETDEETFPELAVQNGLDVVYTHDMLQDVIMSALDQKENAAVQELYKAILYYEENDTFMDLG